MAGDKAKADNKKAVADLFGKNLRSCRKRNGLTQEELGLGADLHRTEIGLLERGQRVPRIDTLVKITAVLGVPPGDLLHGMNWNPSAIQRGGFDR